METIDSQSTSQCLLLQVHYYQYVKCRQEMYDRDIQLIQVVASLMDPDEFMVHLLHKFDIHHIFRSEPSSV